MQGKIRDTKIIHKKSKWSLIGLTKENNFLLVIGLKLQMGSY